MKKVIILCFMCVAALTMHAQKRCVVLDFQVGSNVTAEEIEGISYSFRSNFLPTGYTKLERVMINRTIKNFGYSSTSMTQDQMMRIGRELEANIIVVGTISKFMDEYSADIRVIDVGRRSTIASENANFVKSSYRDAMEKVAKKLANKIRGGSTGVSTQSTTGYTDLGLPSGTQWKDFNATGFYTYDEAISQFGNRLPTKAQWEELKAECQWSWTGSGYKVTGPNGNSISLPAAGARLCDGRVGIVGFRGDYWSSTPKDSENAWGLYFYSGSVNMGSDDRCLGLSVRLVQD